MCGSQTNRYSWPTLVYYATPSNSFAPAVFRNQFDNFQRWRSYISQLFSCCFPSLCWLESLCLFGKKVIQNSEQTLHWVWWFKDPMHSRSNATFMCNWFGTSLFDFSKKIQIKNKWMSSFDWLRHRKVRETTRYNLDTTTCKHHRNLYTFFWVVRIKRWRVSNSIKNIAK